MLKFFLVKHSHEYWKLKHSLARKILTWIFMNWIYWEFENGTRNAMFFHRMTPAYLNNDRVFGFTRNVLLLSFFFNIQALAEKSKIKLGDLHTLRSTVIFKATNKPSRDGYNILCGKYINWCIQYKRYDFECFR